MNREREIRVPNGWVALPVTVAVIAIALGLFTWALVPAVQASGPGGAPNFLLLLGGVIVLGLGIFSCWGYFTLQPNEGRVLILFGSYRGTVRQAGWRWTNPFR